MTVQILFFSTQNSCSAHVRLLHSIDARQLHTTRALDSVAHVDAICFNFPHEGRGVKDEAVSVRRHQQLMRQVCLFVFHLFISACSHLFLCIFQFFFSFIIVKTQKKNVIKYLQACVDFAAVRDIADSGKFFFGFILF